MTRPPVRAGVIGAGLMGRVHADAARRAGATIVAVSDPDSNRGRILAASIGASCESVTSDQLTASRFVDVLHVCTPPDEHYAVCDSALRSGINVICEKPLAQTAGEVQTLLALADESGLQLCPVHQFPFQRGIRRVVEHASSLGTVRHVIAEMCTAGGEGLDDAGRHRIALDILPHPLSLFGIFTTRPLRDTEWRVSAARGGELVISGVSGTVGLSLVLSTRGRPTSNSLRVIGDAGTATADLFHGYAIIEQGRVSRFRKMTRPFVSSTLTLGNAAANGIRRGLSAETAFPGLRDLVGSYYASIRGEASPPISSETSADIALARDRIISLIQFGS